MYAIRSYYVSQLIDANLDREVEDYELQVSSAGIGQPFKVKQQYHKNINRQIEILFKDGKKSIGTLKAVNDDDFEVSRITSYNVCYTKLLRFLPKHRCRPPRTAQ